MTGKCLHGGPERSLQKSVKMKPVLHWRPQDVSARAGRHLPRRAAQESGERYILPAAKLEEQSHLRPLTSDLELQDLGFTLLGAGLALVQYFFTTHPHSSLWNGNMYSVPLCVGST